MSSLAIHFKPKPYYSEFAYPKFSFIVVKCEHILLFILFIIYFILFQSLVGADYPDTSQYPPGSQARGSLTDSYPPHHQYQEHQAYPHQLQGYPQEHQGYPQDLQGYPQDHLQHPQEPLYSHHIPHYQGQYQHYDPNMSNSVFEDGEDGYGGHMDYPQGMTPLPGSLGSVSQTPQPREAPRAVFDDEEDQEPVPPGHPGHPIRVNKPLSSVGSQDHNRNQTQQIGLFSFIILPVFFLSSTELIPFLPPFSTQFGDSNKTSFLEVLSLAINHSICLAHFLNGSTLGFVSLLFILPCTALGTDNLFKQNERGLYLFKLN